MKPKTRIVFFGNEQLATGINTDNPVFNTLLNSSYEIGALVITQKAGAGRKKTQPRVINIAEQQTIPILSEDSPLELKSNLVQINAQLGILVAYGKLIPKSILDIFPLGIINIHPSLLPKHRGSTPIESVILSGETETGASIIELNEKMDAGPLYAQQSLAVSPNISKQDLANQLSSLGNKLLIDSLPEIISGKLFPKPQISAQVTYDRLIQKNDGVIDWSKNAIQIEREIRAYSGWPRSRTALKNIELIITDAILANESGSPGEAEIKDQELLIYAGEKSLRIKKLQPAGKKEMTIREFLRGYATKLN